MTFTSPRSGTDPTRLTLDLLYHISREIASDLDLRTVLRRVLMLSLESVGGNSGSIIVVDEHGSPVDSTIIHTGRVYLEATSQLSLTLEKGLAGWVVRHRQAVIINDTSLDERWFKRPDDAPDQTGPKSALSVPLLAKDDLVGVMTIAHPTPGTFTEEHGALMRAIADLAGITILNARLMEDARRQARVMTALTQSAMAINASLETEETLQRVLEQVQKALDAEAVSLALMDSDRKSLTLQAATSPLRRTGMEESFPLGQGIAGLVAQTGESLMVPDTSADARFDPQIDHLPGIETRAIACAPIHTGGEVIGTLEAFNPAGGFDLSARLVLEGIGSLAGSVIRHAQLYERLQSAHKRYRELFDDSIDLILITDWDGKIRQRNRRAGSAIPIDAAADHGSIFELHAIREGQLAADLRQQLSGQDMVSYESELATPDGPLPVEVFVRQIRIDGESLLQWILHDITERKSLDAQRNDLIAMIYHDLRSPLANVIYSLDMLASMLPPSDKEMRPLIEVANRATERIQRLTSSLLDIQNLEAGLPVTNRRPVETARIIETGLQAIRPLAESKNQSIETQLARELGKISVDIDMITRVVINLLENAVKYSPGKGVIRIGARHTRGQMEIWVQDNGPGIPLAHKEDVFKKFTRLDNTQLGYGLGLSFCRLAIEGHGGRIWVEEPDEQGARFVFTLPLADGEPGDGYNEGKQAGK